MYSGYPPPPKQKQVCNWCPNELPSNSARPQEWGQRSLTKQVHNWYPTPMDLLSYWLTSMLHAPRPQAWRGREAWLRSRYVTGGPMDLTYLQHCTQLVHRSERPDWQPWTYLHRSGGQRGLTTPNGLMYLQRCMQLIHRYGGGGAEWPDRPHGHTYLQHFKQLVHGCERPDWQPWTCSPVLHTARLQELGSETPDCPAGA